VPDIMMPRGISFQVSKRLSKARQRRYGLALHQNWKEIGGLYLEDCRQAIPHDPEISTFTGYMPYALNAEHAEQLWTIAEQLIER